MNSISILGCGWLGEPLATYLLSKNFIVKGSTTSLDKKHRLEEKGIESFQVLLSPTFIGDSAFFDSEILLISIPPKAKTLGIDFHLDQIESIINQCKKSNKLKEIIFVSSTSVYPNIEKTMKEEDADKSHFLFKVEQKVIDYCSKSKKSYLILRFGGLMGADRNPCKYFTSETANDDSMVNYLHQYDAVGSICSLIDENICNETLNILSPLHPTRAQIWQTCNQNAHSQSKNTKVTSKKTVSPQKFFDLSKYQFQFIDPLAFKYL